eukprot:gene18108-12994_t
MEGDCSATWSSDDSSTASTAGVLEADESIAIPPSDDTLLDDLQNKITFISSDESILRAFVRYLFSGCWILELLQIPRSPVAAPSFAPLSLSVPELSEEWWLCGDSIDGIVVQLTVAVALQAFCRSELFLHLSEHRWSTDAFHKVHWLDYARIGRDMVQQHMAAMAESNGDAGERDARSSQVWLLDALYVRLMLTSSQDEVSAMLRSSFKISDSQVAGFVGIVADLSDGLQSLPIDWAVYESTSAVSRKYWAPAAWSSFPGRFPAPALLDEAFRAVGITQSVICRSDGAQESCEAQLTHPFGVAMGLTPIDRCPLIVFDSSCRQFMILDADHFVWAIERVVVASRRFYHSDGRDSIAADVQRCVCDWSFLLAKVFS